MTDLPGNQPPEGYPPQPYPPRPYPPVVYPAPKKGPSALKIVLIVIGVFVGLVLIGVGLLGYEFYKVAKSSNMTITSQPVTEADLGVAIYPGAEHKANVRMTIFGKNMLAATFLTSDSKAQVIAFYKDKLGPDAQFQTILNETQFKLDKGAGESVLVKISSGMGLESGKTRFAITHATKAAAPAPMPAK